MKVWIEKVLQSKSKLFALWCACFLVGVTVASFFEIKLDPMIAWLVIGGGILAVLFVNKIRAGNLVVSLVVMVVCFVIGVVRFGLVFPRDSPARVEFYAGATELTGIIDAEPDRRLDSTRYIVAAHAVDGVVVQGRMLVKNDRYPQFAYGDIVQIQCRLKRPEPIVDEATGQTFRYDLYLALQKVFVVCNQPWITRVASNQGGFVFSLILKGKNALAAKISQLWPEPEASFMAGLLYGYRGGLGSLNELFSRTGVTHIVAVSGFNISVIATILITAATYACVPRQKAFWLVSLGIVAFVIFTGASASVVRAGVMGIISLLAKHVGRAARIGNVMLVAATIMVLQNPLVLWFDAGFQLSFLSTLGLVYVSPLLARWQNYLPTWLGLQESLLSTMSAIIATLPLILYQFGRLSIVAPVVNMLILWLISWLMLAGTVAVALSFVSPTIGALAAWPAHLGMRYIMWVVRWFASFSWASVDMRVPAVVAVAAYGGLVYAIWRRSFSKTYGKNQFVANRKI